MFTGEFWLAASERAFKTLAQTLLSLWLAGDVVFDVLNFNWAGAFGIALGALLISYATSIVSNLSGTNGPSLANEHVRSGPTLNNANSSGDKTVL